MKTLKVYVTVRALDAEARTALIASLTLDELPTFVRQQVDSPNPFTRLQLSFDVEEE